jgi:glycerol-3-phosphate acyltransferase PlsY
MIAVGAAIVCGYLLGSIPVGLLLGKLTQGVDIRDYGSGKTGFTNTLRVLGARRSVWVFAGDFAKGAAAALLPLVFSHDPVVRAAGGLAAVIGHVWPVFAGFRGGRGVLTGAGVLVALDPIVLIVLVPVAAGAFFLFRIMSVVSLSAAIAGAGAFVALAVAGVHSWAYAVVAVIGVSLIASLHGGNIARLRHGTEPRVGHGGDRRSPSRG